MKLDTAMPFIKVGATLLLGALVGGGTTAAVKSYDRPQAAVPILVEFTGRVLCTYPKIEGEMIFDKKK